jgi:hypothetical protein
MEQKILYNVLTAISKGGRGLEQAPDAAYITALAEIGMIKVDWDTTLTDFGRKTLEWLRGTFEKW